MDFDLTPEEEEFRQEVRAFLAEHNPPRDKRVPKRATLTLSRPCP